MTVPLSRRSGWLALAVTVVARAALTLILSLLGWSLLPAALGWHTTVVMTGSMMPRLVPGDLVVSRPVDPASLALGQVLLVDSPDHPGQLRLHRLVRFAPDGRLILRGDANRTADSSPVTRSAVHGVGAMHIPYLGRPVLWADEGAVGPLILTAAALVLLLRLATWWRPMPAGDEAGPADDAPQGDAAGPPTEAGAPVGSIGSAGSAPAGSRPMLRKAFVVATIAVAVIAMASGAADAATRYSARTTTTGSWAASTWFTCANAVVGASAQYAFPLSEASGTTATDISGTATTGSYSSTGITYGVTGPCTHDARTAVTLDGMSGNVVISKALSGSAVSLALWFKASGSHGGMLLFCTNSNGKTVSLALAMNTSGTLVAAVGASTKSVTTTNAYNDDAWHLAVVTVGSAGLNLYVDTDPAVTNAGVTSVPTGAVYTIAGYGNHLALATGTYNYFQGSVGFVAGYASVLTAAQVTAQYTAAQ